MKRWIPVVLAVLLLAGCDRSNPFDETEPATKETMPAAEQGAPTTEAGTEPAATETPATEAPTADASSIDLSVKPSEGGKIMVLMYHNIGDEEEEWVRTPENFRRDLQTLYDKGYRPIRLTDYVRGHIDTPAGLTPVVITIDDARENNFQYLPDGSIDPNSLVGILLDFHKEHPDFPIHATFFANGPVPFRVEGEEQKKIAFLIENGMDIGNHSYGHEDFTVLDGDELQESIGSQAKYLTSIAPEGYKVNTLALPFGSRPDDDSLTHYLQKGTYDGFEYDNVAILNVGWDPWYSPFHTNFDPYAIHRVRASETNVDEVGLYNWLEYFDNNPEERFISDGNPQVVSAPADWEDVMQVPEGLVLNLYEPQE